MTTTTTAPPRPSRRPTRSADRRHGGAIPAGPALAGAGQAQPDQDLAHPGGADRRHAAADHLPGALRLHLRRRDRRLDPRPTCSSCCPASWRRRSPPGAIAIGVNLNTDIEKGVFDRFRVAADRPVGAAGRRGARRRRPLRDRHHLDRSASATSWASGSQTNVLSAIAGCLLAIAVRAVPQLDLGVRRDEGPDSGRGAGHHVPDHPAAELRVATCSCRRLVTAQLDADASSHVNPITHLVAAMRGAVPRYPGGQPASTGRCVWCVGLRRGLHAAGPAGVPQEGLI